MLTKENLEQAKDWNLSDWKRYKMALENLGIEAGKEISIYEFDRSGNRGVVYPTKWHEDRGIGFVFDIY